MKSIKKYQIYHNSFSSAVKTAREMVESIGYEISESSWFVQITTGLGRPKEGKTFKCSINLLKDSIPQKKMLHIQIYNMGNDIANNFELNFYIN